MEHAAARASPLWRLAEADLRGSLSGRGAVDRARIGHLHVAPACPRVEPTDVEQTPWVSEVVDAEALPYASASLANLVLVDVFHHLARPARFFDEAVRALAPGGRIVVLDPYCSPVSTPGVRALPSRAHRLTAEPFEDDVSIAAEPLASNQARATLAFFRHDGELARAMA